MSIGNLPGAASGRPRLDYLDAARGIAILLVVWLHLGRNLPLPEAVLYPTTIFASFSVPALFMISGYLYYFSLHKPGISTFKLAWSRTRTSLVPFYALSFLFLPLVYLNQRINPEAAKTWQSSLWSMTHLDISENLPSGVLWFLFVLFMFLIFTLLVHKLLRSDRLTMLILFGMSLLMLLTAPWVTDIYFLGINRIFKTYFYFIFGMYGLRHLVGREPSLGLVMGFIAASLILFIGHVYIYPSQDYLNFLMEMADRLFSCVAIILFCQFVSVKIKRMRILSFFGLHSMSIFVFHVPVFIMLMVLARRSGFYSMPIASWIILFLSIALPILMEYVLSFVPWLHSILLGRAPTFRARRKA